MRLGAHTGRCPVSTFAIALPLRIGRPPASTSVSSTSASRSWFEIDEFPKDLLIDRCRHPRIDGVADFGTARNSDPHGCKAAPVQIPLQRYLNMEHAFMHHQIASELQAVIDKCERCHSICVSEIVNHCLQVGGEHARPDHITIMLDCAQFCATSADFMLRNSTHHAHVCGECADICAACAASCEKLEGMEVCVAACRACEISCRHMAAMAH